MARYIESLRTNITAMQIIKAIRIFIKERFSLHEDKADEREIIESICKNVEFKGTNLWVLIFAIFIASIGLNVNSAAVVIGAMLISPIMGPIMGIGLGIGIYDIELIKKATKNFIVAAIISISVSFLYFCISPIQEAKSELLARTTPTIWDVFIALFGGFAGIVAGTRKEKSNVIPGVSIATALMPPLCTAGFGLAIGNLFYFLGALYLFFINSVFICISTYVVIRYLHFSEKAFENAALRTKVSRIILLIVIITALPSVYLTYRIVEKSIFETNANLFLRREFKFKNTFILNRSVKYEKGVREIDLVIFGDTLSSSKCDSLKNRLPFYNIGGTKLSIHQGINAQGQIDFEQVKASILEEVLNEKNFREKRTEDSVTQDTHVFEAPLPDIKSELKALIPDIVEYSINKSVVKSIDTVQTDTVILFLAKFSKPISRTEKLKLTNWLKSRLQTDSIKLFIE